MTHPEPIPTKRTMHISVSAEATDEEVDRFEDVVVDAAYDFHFPSGADAFASSHAGNCEEDPHCGGANPWRERSLAAEAKVKRVEKLRDEWLTDHGDWQGRPRSWWDEKPYGEELRAALDGDK